MVLLARINSTEGEYFQYRKAAKFISEILIVLSILVVVSCIGTLIGFAVELRQDNNENVDAAQKDIAFALFIYTIVILIMSISDIIFALVLRLGIQKLKLSYCLFWRGATVTSLIVTGMLTLAFVTMVSNLVVMLGYLPSLVSKPFSLWMVNAFILELGELRTFPFHTSSAIPPAKASFSLDDLESLKKTTTVFHMKRSFGRGRRHGQGAYIVTSKLGSIPEVD